MGMWLLIHAGIIYNHVSKTGPMYYSTMEVNPSLGKPPLNFNDRLAKLGLTSLVK